MRWLWAGVLLSLLAFPLYKLHFGVDLDDEAFYLAIPYRFVLGDVPFVDEHSAQQTAGLLTWPAVRLWIAWAGEPEGLVLFMRRVYYAFTVLVGLAAFGCLRRTEDLKTAALAAALPVAFVPFCVPAASYNTLGMGFLGLGLYLAWRADGEEGRSLRWLFASGAAHALACLAFPPYAACIALTSVLLAVTSRAGRLRSFAAYAAPVGVVGFLIGASVLAVGIENVRGVGQFASLDAGGGIEKLLRLGRQVVRGPAHEGWWLGWLLITVALARARRPAAVFFAAGAPLALAVSQTPSLASFGVGHVATNFFVAWLGLAAPVLAIGLREPSSALRPLSRVWLPSAAAGALSGWASGNGFMNASLGLAPAALLSGWFLVRLVRENGEGLPRWLRRNLPPLPVALSAGLCLLLTANAIYRDFPLAMQDSRVASGPYAGLRTTQARRDFVEELQYELHRAAQPGGKILVYNAFSAGYLMTTMRPASPSPWIIVSPERREAYAAAYREQLDPRNLVLVLKYKGVALDDPLHLLVEASHQKILDRPRFALYSGSR